MSNTAIEVITSVQRRRRWSAAEKERLVAGALEPGASVSLELVIDTVVCLTLAKWETVSGQFGGYLSLRPTSMHNSAWLRMRGVQSCDG
jgi:Transposase